MISRNVHKASILGQNTKRTKGYFKRLWKLTRFLLIFSIVQTVTGFILLIYKTIGLWVQSGGLFSKSGFEVQQASYNKLTCWHKDNLNRFKAFFLVPRHWNFQCKLNQCNIVILPSWNYNKRITLVGNMLIKSPFLYCLLIIKCRQLHQFVTCH